MIDGAKPLYGRVKMYKQDMKYSQTVRSLRDKILATKSNKNKTLDIVIRNEHDFPSLSVSDVSTAIKKYMKANMENHKGIESALDKTRSLICIKRANKQSFDKIMKEFDIGQDHRIKQLRGSKGLRALTEIGRYVCLGQYVGVYYTKNEYDQIFGHSGEHALRNQYAFDVELNDDDDNDVDIVIDGFGIEQMIQESRHLHKINDCRLDINQEIPTKEDKKYKNIEFVNCTINNWPTIMVVTSRKIKKNEEILGWYGSNFGAAVIEKTEYDSFKDHIRTLIDREVLNSMGHEFDNDHWNLTEN